MLQKQAESACHVAAADGTATLDGHRGAAFIPQGRCWVYWLQQVGPARSGSRAAAGIRFPAMAARAIAGARGAPFRRGSGKP